MTDIQIWFASLETPMRFLVMIGAAIVSVLIVLTISIAYLALLNRDINKRFETFIALSPVDRRWVRIKAKEFAGNYIGDERNDTLSQIILISFGFAPIFISIGISVFMLPELTSLVSNTTPINPPSELTSLLLGIAVSLMAFYIIGGLPWPKAFREHLHRGGYVKDWKKLETVNKHALLKAIGRGDIIPQQDLDHDTFDAYSRREARQYIVKFILILLGALVLITTVNTLIQSL